MLESALVERPSNVKDKISGDAGSTLTLLGEA